MSFKIWCEMYVTMDYLNLHHATYIIKRTENNIVLFVYVANVMHALNRMNVVCGFDRN